MLITGRDPMGQSSGVIAILGGLGAAIAWAVLLYRERLTVRQRSGVVAIAVGVAVLAGLRA
jgi:multidrug transporter EmrE-like cation transporter